MEPYNSLASVYDYLVSGVDFEGWIDYLEEIIRRLDRHVVSVADLACGTGNTLFPLARRGYQAIGVDLSAEMLLKAREKAAAEGLKVELFKGDIRDFLLPRPVDLITCFHDGLNYLTEYRDLFKTFQCVFQNLSPKGLFIFDLNAVRWLSGLKTETTVAEEEHFTLIWNSTYCAEEEIWEVCLTGFIKEGELYRKFKETHREKAYRPEEVKQALSQAGFKLLAAYDAFSFKPIHEGSRRHFYVAEKYDIIKD